MEVQGPFREMIAEVHGARKLPWTFRKKFQNFFSSYLTQEDLSRLGREYLQVGQYTELVFPSYGVRFIAVNDGVDSLYESTNDFTPFRNIINEMYAKDTSQKGRSSVKIKAETGARIASRSNYGYMKDPDDPKRHLVPDPDTAPVVKRIFALCTSGLGPTRIANQLRQEEIPSPAYHYYAKYGVQLSTLDISKPYAWSSATVPGHQLRCLVISYGE